MIHWCTLTITMDSGWNAISEPDPGSDLQGVVGYLNPSGYRTVPRILWDTRRIESQLAEAGGLVGYSMRAKLPQKQFWAVAAWESDAALDTFVESDPHAGIRLALKRVMAESWFERFELDGTEVPMTVDEALERV